MTGTLEKEGASMSAQPEVAITIVTGGHPARVSNVAGESESSVPVPSSLQQLQHSAGLWSSRGSASAAPVPMPLDRLASASAGSDDSASVTGGAPVPTPLGQMAPAGAEAHFPEPTDLPGAVPAGVTVDDVPVPSGTPDTTADIGSVTPLDLDELEHAAQAGSSKKSAGKKKADTTDTTDTS